MRTESEAVSQDGDATKPSRAAPCLLQHTEESPPREEEARRAALAPPHPAAGAAPVEEAGAASVTGCPAGFGVATSIYTCAVAAICAEPSGVVMKLCRSSREPPPYSNYPRYSPGGRLVL